jgi:hypothetical protein
LLSSTVTCRRISQSYRTPIRLKNKIDIQVTTNNFRAPRGRAIAGAIFDEVAFWKSEESTTPDFETYRSVRPGMTLPSSMLVGISTAYRKKGLLYEKWRDLGKDNPDVLVIQADTRSFNPKIDEIVPGAIDAALAEDRPSALAEYFSVFRDDLQDAFPREIIEKAVVEGRFELSPVSGVHYKAFIDPSGGSSDSMALAIGHAPASLRGVLDVIREVRPPFSPEAVTKEFCDLMKGYGIRQVKGDRYAGEWVAEEFKSNGIFYEVAEKTKSEYYLEMIPLLNAGRVELLDNKRMVGQFASLERRTMPMGREAIQKPRYSAADDSLGKASTAHDDVSNVVAACMVEVAGKPNPLEIWAKLGWA